MARERGEQTPTEAEAERAPQRSRTTAPTPSDRALYVETQIDQAIRRGDFDDLPGAGKPLPGLGGVHDPDWWIRAKIERERLTGLGPAAISLRVENAALLETLDAMFHERDVRAHLDDFNLRIIEARRQLQGGPPVVTPTRDVDAEVAAWKERRAERAAAATAERSAAEPERRTRWLRSAAKRRVSKSPRE